MTSQMTVATKNSGKKRHKSYGGKQLPGISDLGVFAPAQKPPGARHNRIGSSAGWVGANDS